MCGFDVDAECPNDDVDPAELWAEGAEPARGFDSDAAPGAGTTAGVVGAGWSDALAGVGFPGRTSGIPDGSEIGEASEFAGLTAVVAALPATGEAVDVLLTERTAAGLGWLFTKRPFAASKAIPDSAAAFGRGGPGNIASRLG